MALNDFQTGVAQVITQMLGLRSYTISELAEDTGYSYWTVRNVIRELEEQGTVKPADNRYRNTKYRLAEAGEARNSMPVIINNGRKFKLIEILGLRHANVTSHASRAADALPMHVTRLLNYARILATQPALFQERDLRLLRVEISKDREALAEALAVYEQLLDNPVNWNAQYLANFHHDPSFDGNEVIDAYKHYFQPAVGNTESLS